jgi:lipopolysaccharide transport system ATP-binding protein
MPVIEFDHVSKVYRLGAGQGSLRQAIPQLAKRLVGRSNSDDNQFWALDDVSFKIEQGEVVGIIGHNGAGKSTTLKLLSKVTFPTMGHIHTKGRMAALIELGAGFHPDLTGRENIYLNGSVLGLKRREIDAQLSNIIEFAELEKFIDTPVKRYSSGMYVRLAFAVAAHVKADLMLVDEVLSVGDSSFQQKSLTKMAELRESGATIIFISHNLAAVQGFCRRLFLLSGGKLVAEGKPSDVIDMYRNLQRESALRKVNAKLGAASQGYEIYSPLTDVQLLNDNGVETSTFDPERGMTVHIQYDAPEPIRQPEFRVQIFRALDGYVCCEPAFKLESVHGDATLAGAGAIDAVINPVQLLPGAYYLQVHLLENHDGFKVYTYGTVVNFEVSGELEGYREAGVFQPNVDWQLNPVQVP